MVEKVDFARCPKRTSTCPSPSYCSPACEHLPPEMRADTPEAGDDDVDLAQSAGALS